MIDEDEEDVKDEKSDGASVAASSQKTIKKKKIKRKFGCWKSRVARISWSPPDPVNHE